MTLEELRVNQGLSREALADMAGVPYHVIAHAETGGTPRTGSAFKIATALGVRVTDLWPVERKTAA